MPPVADKCYLLLRDDPRHPSLHFKPVGKFWSLRVGRDYHALALCVGEDCVRVWVGTHAEYDRLISR